MSRRALAVSEGQRTCPFDPFLTLNSFSNFLIVLETIAPGECLIQVLSKRDELRVYIRKFTHFSTSDNTGRNHDLDSHIHYLGIFASQMMGLLSDCLPKE